MRWAVLDGVCACVCVTHVVYSRGPSSPGYTCTPRHRHCSRPRCDSYTCGYSWAPTDQGDRLKDKDNNHSRRERHNNSLLASGYSLKYIISYTSAVPQPIAWGRCHSTLKDVYSTHYTEWGLKAARCVNYLANQ